jgi:hypothetical protein
MDRSNAKKVSGVIRRYVIAKGRVRHFAFSEAEYVMEGVGRQILDGMTQLRIKGFEGEIDPTSPKVITSDYSDPDFFAAIIEGRDGVIDMSAADLKKYRQYVLHGKGSLPVAPEC